MVMFQGDLRLEATRRDAVWTRLGGDDLTMTT